MIRRLLLCAAVLPCISACRALGGGACSQPPEYNSSDDRAPLAIPAGLDGPDTRTALRIPPLDTPERPRGPDEPCLDAPPRYETPRPQAQP
jgi:hypothetical protein